MCAHVDEMFIKNGRLVPICVAALDVMAMQIETIFDGYTCSAHIKIKEKILKHQSLSHRGLLLSVISVESTHDHLVWSTTKLAELLYEFGLFSCESREINSIFACRQEKSILNNMILAAWSHHDGTELYYHFMGRDG
jgi:hypothetical protein